MADPSYKDDALQTEREVNPMWPAAYGFDDAAGIGVHHEPSMGGITAAPSIKGYTPSVQDPSLIGQRRGISPVISTTIPDMILGVPGSVRNTNGSPLIKGETNILFVDGLSTDCTRGEATGKSELFTRNPAALETALVLCFVEFVDSKCARTAINALHGYKFDDKNLNPRP